MRKKQSNLSLLVINIVTFDEVVYTGVHIGTPLQAFTDRFLIIQIGGALVHVSDFRIPDSLPSDDWLKRSV